MLPSCKLHSRPNRRHRFGRTTAVIVVASGLALSGCGRSAPVDALDTSGDPDIAGVSVTSPDAVVATDPTSPDETVTPTTTLVEEQQQAQATYVVEPGDTLSVIADRFNVSLQALADFNGIADMNTLSPGQELVIPPQAVEVSVVDAAETTTSTQP